MSFTAMMATAQTYESIKTLIILDMKKAKVEIDKAMSISKFTSKPEAYILKTTIYAALAMDEASKNTPAGQDFAKEADIAFQKYLEMEPTQLLISDPVYQNGPINLYSNFYTAGYSAYSELVKNKEKAPEKWDVAYQKLKRAVEYSNLLISKKLLQTTLDTNVLILAGITAESSSSKDDAVIYYSRLADNKVIGDGFETVYRFLVSYYFNKKNMLLFEKYKALGKELFPKSEYFDFDKVDFAVGLVEGFNEKLNALDEILLSDPTNYKANESLWSIIYDSINLNKEREVQPKDFGELEKRMFSAINKTIAAKPNEVNNYIFIGNYYIGKKDVVNQARQAHADDMKARTKPGTMASKEDIAKRDKFDKEYAEAMDAIREPYENAAKLFASKTKLEVKEKSQYKNIAGYLAEIYELKKKLAKGKPTDIAKFAEEEKKWNEVYESIK